MLLAARAMSSAIAGSIEWVGSKACTPCHSEIARRYAATPMAQSSGDARDLRPAISNQPAVFQDAHSAYQYSVRTVNGEYVLNVRSNAPEGQVFDRSLRWFIGSGSMARTFLIDTGGFLYESPATYYTRRKAWDFSPGYAAYSYPFLTRAIAPACLDCHATGVRAIPGTQNAYESPPFLEAGVGCERCHGPGATHIRTQRKADIVNPSRLEPNRRDSICAQCHLAGQVRVERAGRSQSDFRAGDRLSDYSISFVSRDPSKRMRVTSHTENLAQSACFRNGSPTMWCGSCHDPHSVLATAERASWFRSKCLTCHADVDCKENSRARSSKGNDCTACHMPKAPVSDAEHMVYTDHSIPRRPSPQSDPSRNDIDFFPFSGAPASARDLGLAYAIVALRERNESRSARAFDLLSRSLSENPNEPETLSYLADLYRSRGDNGNAESLYQRLSRLAPERSSSWVALGGYSLSRGETAQAIVQWKRALEISPALVLVRMNLATALVRAGRTEEARQVLRQALEFNPTFNSAREMLRNLEGIQPR